MTVWSDVKSYNTYSISLLPSPHSRIDSLPKGEKNLNVMPGTLKKKKVIIRNNDHFLTNRGQRRFGHSLCIEQHGEHEMVALSLASWKVIERENVSRPSRQAARG